METQHGRHDSSWRTNCHYSNPGQSTLSEPANSCHCQPTNSNWWPHCNQISIELDNESELCTSAPAQGSLPKSAVVGCEGAARGRLRLRTEDCHVLCMESLNNYRPLYNGVQNQFHSLMLTLQVHYVCLLFNKVLQRPL